MRRRILISTLLVVAITVTVLGGPLALTTWRLVEDFTHADLAGRLRQVVATLDTQLQSDRPVDLSAVAIAVFAPRWPLAALSDNLSTPGTRAVLRLASDHLDPESHRP